MISLDSEFVVSNVPVDGLALLDSKPSAAKVTDEPHFLRGLTLKIDKGKTIKITLTLISTGGVSKACGAKRA